MQILGVLLLSAAQLMQPVAETYSFCTRENKAIKAMERCESEAEGRIVYEACEFEDGTGMSRVYHVTDYEADYFKLTRVPGYYSHMAGVDFDSDGVFDYGIVMTGHQGQVLFDPESEEILADMKKKALLRASATNDFGYYNPIAEEIAEHKAYLDELRQIAMKACRQD